MKIQITGAERNTFWYAGLIGQTFEVIREANGGLGYKVAHHDPADLPETGYYVGKADCVVVTEEPSNITVLKDESLGGIVREYREVATKAGVGDRIKATGENPGFFTDGEIGTVYRLDTDGDAWATFANGVKACVGKPDVETGYLTLEPTDIVRINGERLRMVDRKAAVGERVIVTGERATFRIGDLFVVENDDWTYPAVGLRNGWNALDGHYRVLEPVESAQLSDQSAPDQAAEIIAKLATRVTALEQRMTALEAGEPKPLTFAEVNADLARERRESRAVYSRPATYDAPSYLSDQQRRDAIVEQAKADVADLLAKACGDIPSVWETFPAIKYIGHIDVKFAVDRDKRKVSALAYLHYGQSSPAPVLIGRSVCAKGDVFNVHIGKAIAVRRLLGLEVPADYVTCPHPTEARVGDVVKSTEDGESYTVVPEVELDTRVLSVGYVNKLLSKRVVIIDDSRTGEDESDSAETRKEVA